MSKNSSVLASAASSAASSETSLTSLASSASVSSSPSASSAFSAKEEDCLCPEDGGVVRPKSPSLSTSSSSSSFSTSETSFSTTAFLVVALVRAFFFGALVAVVSVAAFLRFRFGAAVLPSPLSAARVGTAVVTPGLNDDLRVRMRLWMAVVVQPPPGYDLVFFCF